jgi:hypothetical chaperone protein
LINLGFNKPETRTVLFWDNEESKAIIGDEWINRFVKGHAWRLIQSPKSFLNSKEEVETVFWGRVRWLWDIITPIIRNLRDRCIMATWYEITDVKLWRPVRFHNTDEVLDKKAQDRLEQYARNAWFGNIEFEFEPIAAAKTFENPELLDWRLLLVADFWWWTSDFSIVDYTKDWIGKILSNEGVYVAWNSFDQELSLRFFSQFLGNWTQFKSWSRLLPIPSNPYFILSDWKLIHQLNDKKVRQSIRDIQWAIDEDAINRLLEITENPELWYEYFRMVESTKIASSTNDPVTWTAHFFRRAFEFVLAEKTFRAITAEQLEKIREALQNSLRLAWVNSERVGKILLVGWTGQLKVVQEMLESELWSWKILKGDTFNAIGKGLSM